MRMWLESPAAGPRKEGGTTLQRIRPPAAATAAVDLPASMSEVVEVVVEVAVGAVEVAPATVDGPAAATGWPAAAVDVPAGTCCGTCTSLGGCLSPLSACCGTCCGAPQPTHALALGASSHGSCHVHMHEVHVHVHVHVTYGCSLDA
eukprot:scaffold36851_cov56-Phaeocystis_antarctica.AAC.3